MSNLILRYYFLVCILLALYICKHFIFYMFLSDLILNLSLFIIHFIFNKLILIAFNIFIINDIVLNLIIWWCVLKGLYSLWLRYIIRLIWIDWFLWWNILNDFSGLNSRLVWLCIYLYTLDWNTYLFLKIYFRYFIFLNLILIVLEYHELFLFFS